MANGQAEVYVALVAPKVSDLLAVFGCAFSSGHAYFLGPVGGLGSGGGGFYDVANETLAGSVVGYAETKTGAFSGEWFVIARDLRTGRILRKEPTGARIKPKPFSVGIGPASAVVVKTDGALAWILETGEEEGSYQVHAADKSGSRVLASGSDIDPKSLALAGSTFYWTQGGKPASAVLN